MDKQDPTKLSKKSRALRTAVIFTIATQLGIDESKVTEDLDISSVWQGVAGVITLRTGIGISKDGGTTVKHLLDQLG